MQPFTKLTAVAVPLDDASIDTGRIFPSRFLRKPRSAGYGRASLAHDELAATRTMWNVGPITQGFTAVAIFQLVENEDRDAISRIVLTASGGPFRGRTDLEGITVEEALDHAGHDREVADLFLRHEPGQRVRRGAIVCAPHARDHSAERRRRALKREPLVPLREREREAEYGSIRGPLFGTPLDGDIVQTASAAGSFSVLLEAATKAGLVDALKAPGPYTVFAPTDAAFGTPITTPG